MNKAQQIARIDAFVAECQRLLAIHHAPRPAPWGDLETLLTGEEWFALTTASPLQRAICRVVDGKPIAELWDDPAVRRAFGHGKPDAKPFEFALLAGVRSGKSLFAGACGVHWAWTCDVSSLGPGEVPRLPIVSVHKDLAQVIYGHIAGRIQAAPKLRELLVEPPSGERILLRHPTGRSIEIMVSAGARAGVTLVARWLIGAIFDEFPRMIGEGEGVVNWADMRAAIMQRILPGGGVAHIGSPWAPFGPAFDMFTEHFGKPTADLAVVRAPAYDMNPAYWTAERCAEFKARDPDGWETDGEANFATPAGAMYPDALLKRNTRKEPIELEPEDHLTYVAACDPATRGNAWTLDIVTQIEGKLVVALSREWVGSRLEPLDPEEILQEIAAIVDAYRIKYVHTDQWSSDALKALARRYDLKLIEHTSQGAEVFERYQRILDELKIDNLELPPDPVLQADLRRVKKVVTRLGMAIDLPKTSDGRHCDHAPSLVLACAQHMKHAKTPEPPAGTPEAINLEAHREKVAFLRQRERDEKDRERRMGRFGQQWGGRRR